MQFLADDEVLGAREAEASSASITKRHAVNGTFVELLKQRLAVRKVSVLSAELARRDSTPIWILTLQLPNQHVIVLRARVAGPDPYDPPLATDLAQRVFVRCAL